MSVHRNSKKFHSFINCNLFIHNSVKIIFEKLKYSNKIRGIICFFFFNYYSYVFVCQKINIDDNHSKFTKVILLIS
jgi:hypothetical protein